jgi:hypothetical protein
MDEMDALGFFGTLWDPSGRFSPAPPKIAKNQFGLPAPKIVTFFINRGAFCVLTDRPVCVGAWCLVPVTPCPPPTVVSLTRGRCKERVTMKKNAKVILLSGAAFLILIAIIAVAIIVLRPFFNLANVVSGGH